MWPKGQNEHGKITSSWWLTQTYPEEIEADLQRYYGTDFRDLGSGLSWRRMLVLVNALPPESATMTAIRNDTPDEALDEMEMHPELAQWSGIEGLLALLVDEMRNLTWSFLQSRTEEKLPRPEPLPRPGLRSRPRGRGRRLEDMQRLDPRLRGLSPAEAQQKIFELTGRSYG
jgi:hypothetical protein